MTDVAVWQPSAVTGHRVPLNHPFSHCPPASHLIPPDSSVTVSLYKELYVTDKTKHAPSPRDTCPSSPKPAVNLHRGPSSMAGESQWKWAWMAPPGVSFAKLTR